MSTTSDKSDKKISPIGDISDDDAKIVNNFRDDGMYEFLSKYFKEFNPIGQVLDSYNQVYNGLIDIIQKFKLQYIIKNAKA